LGKAGPQQPVAAVDTETESVARTIPTLKYIKIRAARSLRSGYIRAFVNDGKQFELFTEHAPLWTVQIDPRARLSIELIKILIHKVATKGVGSLVMTNETKSSRVHSILEEQNNMPSKEAARSALLHGSSSPPTAQTPWLSGLTKRARQIT